MKHYTPLLMAGSWMVLLVTFLILHPSPKSPLFWLLIVPVFLTGAAYTRLARRNDRLSIQQFTEWSEKLAALAVVCDVDDDGHLYESFDADEWERIFQELQRMPPNSRSLRLAINAVAPDFTPNVC